jgi:hypothetical protein
MAEKESYEKWLKQDLTSLIEGLELDDFKKHFLKSRWLDQVLWMEKKASTNQKRYYILRLASIIGGIIVPALVSLSITNENVRVIIQTITFIISLIVALSVALEEFFRFGDRWRHYRQTVECLKMEGWQFFQLAGNYKSCTKHEDAYKDFATRVEELQQGEIKIYITEIAKEKPKKDGKEASG